MPVLVTPVDGALGQRTVLALLEEGGEVRAYGPDVPPFLRGAGAILARGDLDDEGRLEAALEQVHTVVHLGVDVLAPSAERLLVSASTLVRAASNAGVRRVVALSVPGADAVSGDPLRRAAGVIEADLRAAALPTVVVRASLVDRPELRAAIADAAPPPPGTVVAPVRLDDLVELLVALDAARSTASEGHVVFAADGPERIDLADYRGRVSGAGRVGRRYVAAADVPLLAPSLSGPWITDEPAVFDAWTFAGLRPRPVTDLGG